MTEDVHQGITVSGGGIGTLPSFPAGLFHLAFHGNGTYFDQDNQNLVTGGAALSVVGEPAYSSNYFTSDGAANLLQSAFERYTSNTGITIVICGRVSAASISSNHGVLMGDSKLDLQICSYDTAHSYDQTIRGYMSAEQVWLNVTSATVFKFYALTCPAGGTTGVINIYDLTDNLSAASASIAIAAPLSGDYLEIGAVGAFGSANNQPLDIAFSAAATGVAPLTGNNSITNLAAYARSAFAFRGNNISA